MYLHSADPIIGPGTRSNAARATIRRRCIAGRAAAWAKLCGFTLNTVMHHWGAAGDSILLYERLR